MAVMRRSATAALPNSLGCGFGTGWSRRDQRLRWRLAALGGSVRAPSGTSPRTSTPWLLNWFGSGAGDYIQTQFNYTQGALKYLNADNQLQLGHQRGHAKPRWGPLADGVYGGFLAGTAVAGTLADCRRTDHSMERQRGLRALLEPALADVTLRRLHESGVRQHSQ